MVVLDGLEGVYDLKGNRTLLRLPSLHAIRVKTKLVEFLWCQVYYLKFRVRQVYAQFRSKCYKIANV